MIRRIRPRRSEPAETPDEFRRGLAKLTVGWCLATVAGVLAIFLVAEQPGRVAAGPPSAATVNWPALSSAAGSTLPITALPVIAEERGMPPTGTATAVPGGPPPAFTLLATADGTIPGYAAPGSRQTGWVPATWYTVPSTLPVIATRPGWLDVRLAQRPDQSTTWVRAQNVRLSVTPYAIVVNLATTHLSLYYHGQLVFSAPAGVGAIDDPTPPGQYFIAMRAAAPTPAYGPFTLVTSDHSQAISNWEGSGDAVIGIHGPIGADQQIGTTGARISHGCIRLHDSDLAKLNDVPAGTPVTILPG